MAFGMEDYQNNLIEFYGQDLPTPEMKLRQLETELATLRSENERLRAQPSASMKPLELGLRRYIEELEMINSECMRPREDGTPCSQCYEREKVIARLQQITQATQKG